MPTFTCEGSDNNRPLSATLKTDEDGDLVLLLDGVPIVEITVEGCLHRPRVLHERVANQLKLNTEQAIRILGYNE